ncbi:MAG TPA: polysaccharide deacetylase family protein [Burkholderiaceae bacterium]|nr:polysaccharide deacetylase family protein [Burkholderiaceae bacterium]
MSPVFVASAVWHLLMATAWIAMPAWWPVWLAALVVNHLVLTVAGLLPRCALLGPNLRRLPAAARARGEVAITLDDGPDPEVTPRVLAQLREAGARATFFCIGQRLRRHPELARAIVTDGHLIANHTEHHSHRFAFLGPGGFRREIDAAQRTIEALAGRKPRFFRAPAGLRNPLLQPVLAALDLQLTAWTRRGYDTVRGDADRVFDVLTRDLAAGDILLLHDGHAARTAGGDPVVLAVLPRLLARLRERGLTPVTLDEAMPAVEPLRRRSQSAVAPDGRPLGTP